MKDNFMDLTPVDPTTQFNLLMSGIIVLSFFAVIIIAFLYFLTKWIKSSEDEEDESALRIKAGDKFSYKTAFTKKEVDQAIKYLKDLKKYVLESEPEDE